MKDAAANELLILVDFNPYAFWYAGLTAVFIVLILIILVAALGEVLGRSSSRW